MFLCLVLPLSIVISGCDSNFGTGNASYHSADGGFGGELGATPGGAQDINYIRALIDNGYVPQADNFYIEGIYSEYDLPVNGEPGEHLLNLRTASAISAEEEFPGDGLYVQIGFSVNIES